MAVTQDDLLIAIEVQSGKSVTEIARVKEELRSLGVTMKETTTHTADTSNALSGVGFGLVKLQAAIEIAKQAYDAYKKTIGDTVNAYFAAIDAERKLANALANSGRFTKEAVERFRDFATEIQRTSVLSDDFVMDLAAQATAMGKTEQQTQSLITASAGLAAMTGRDVKGVFDTLVQTYKGVSRGVAYLDTRIQALTDTQLKSGKAVDIIAEKFGSFAEDEIVTWQGKSKQLTNSLDDLKEAIGAVVAEIFHLGNSGSVLKDTVESITKEIITNRTEIVAWGNMFVDIIKKIGIAISIVKETFKIAMDGFVLQFEYATFAIQKILNTEGSLWQKLFKTDPGEIKKTEAEILKTIAGTQEKFDKIVDSLKKLGGEDEANKNLEHLNRNIGDITEGAFDIESQAGKAGDAIVAMSDKGKSALEDLAKFVADVKAKVDQIGMGRAAQIEALADAQRAELVVIAEKAKAEGVALSMISAQVQEAERLIKLQADKTLDEEKLKVSKQLLEENKQLAAYNKQAGMLAQDIIADELAIQLDILKAKEQQLEFDGLINDEIRSRIADQAAQLEKAAAIQSKGAPSREFEAPIKAGEEIADMISGSFAGAMGMATGVGAVVGAAQAVVDFIPQMLDSITGLINSITDLPTVLMDAVKNLLNSLDRFVADFIPNLINAIDGILEAIVSFVEKIPDTFIQMLDKIPQMLLNLLDKLPDLVQRLVPALITMAPKIMVAMINFAINHAPKIAMKMVEVMAKEIPKAILAGIREGLKALMSIFKTFKLPKMDIDPAAIAKNLKKAFAQLSGATSKLFAVEDLTGAAANKSKDLVTKVVDAGKATADKIKGLWDWLKDLWGKLLQALKDVWLWVWGLLQKAWSLLTDAWRWVYGLLTKAWDALTAVWQKVWATMQVMIEKIMSGIMDAFVWAVNLLGKTWDALIALLRGAVDFLGSVWNGAVNFLRGTVQWLGEVFNGAVAGLQNIGNFFRDVFNSGAAVFERVIGIFQNAIGSITGVFQNVVNSFSGAFSSLKDIFNDTIRPIFDGFGKAINGVIDGFKGIFNKLVDMLNGLKIGPFGYSISAGRLGSWSGQLIPEIDFVPGKIPRFADGGIVGGKSSVSGDSVINDKILSLLSPGEAVIPRSKMDNPVIGMLIEAILDGKYPVKQMAEGGFVNGNNAMSNRDSGITFQRPATQGFAPQQQAQGNVYNITQNIKIENSGAQMDENFVRTKIMPVIRQGLRRETLDGKLIISDRGIF